MVEIVSSWCKFGCLIYVYLLFFLLHIEELKHHLLHKILECPRISRLLNLSGTIIVRIQQVLLSSISTFMIGAPWTGEVEFSSTLLRVRHVFLSARHVIDIIHLVLTIETWRVMSWIAIGWIRFHAVILGVVTRVI